MYGFLGLGGVLSRRDSAVTVTRDWRRIVMKDGWRMFDMDLAMLTMEGERTAGEYLGQESLVKDGHATSLTIPRRSTAHLSWIKKNHSDVDCLKVEPIVEETSEAKISFDQEPDSVRIGGHEVEKAHVGSYEVPAKATPVASRPKSAQATVERPPNFYEYHSKQVSAPPKPRASTRTVEKPPAFYDYKRKPLGRGPSRVQAPWAPKTAATDLKQKAPAKETPAVDDKKVEAKAPPASKAPVSIESAAKPAMPKTKSGSEQRAAPKLITDEKKKLEAAISAKEKKPEAKKKAEPVKAKKKAEPVKVEKKAEPVKAEKKAEPVKAEKKAEPVKAEKKAKPVVAEKKAEPVVAEKRAEPVVAEKKAAPIKAEKNPEPVIAEKKSEPAKQEVRLAQPVKADKKLEPVKHEVKLAQKVKEEKKAEPVKQEVKLAQPVQQAKKAEPVKQEVKLAQPVQQAKKAEPVKQEVKLAQPVQLAKKAEPVRQEVKLAQPVQLAKKAEPVKQEVKLAQPVQQAKKPEPVKQEVKLAQKAKEEEKVEPVKLAQPVKQAKEAAPKGRTEILAKEATAKPKSAMQQQKIVEKKEVVNASSAQKRSPLGAQVKQRSSIIDSVVQTVGTKPVGFAKSAPEPTVETVKKEKSNLQVIAGVEVEKLKNKDSLKRLTVPRLKEVLSEMGLKTTGKKKDLINRILLEQVA
eukprot:CAMPEP_0113953914 /NCGR_PEP_ID=MMETSP0011_2-20120614/121_1 /TAXON_ID=101924 /ORGANISM="Rhodosorus marinus" /LENGTH=688 /DNA_ID=CAMNT_0000962703 /DNA_START=130 /DNA_END=2196 /DNA_ORIENTATION=+ /assembly_acc=CAM_ASM_000156